MKPIKKMIRKVPYHAHHNKDVSTSFALFIFFLSVFYLLIK